MMKHKTLQQVYCMLFAPVLMTLVLAVGCSTHPRSTTHDSSNRMNNRQSGTMYYPVHGKKKILKLKRNAPEKTQAGEEYPYTLKVTNVSNFPAHDIVLKERGNFNVIEGEGLARLDEDNQSEVKNDASGSGWGLGDLKPGESKTVKMIGLAQEEGTIRSCLSLDFQCSQCNSIEVVKPRLLLSRRFVDENGNTVSSVYPCDDVYAVYNTDNRGSGNSKDVSVSETFPNGMNVNGTSSIMLNPGSIQAGQSVNNRVSMEHLESGHYEGRATAKSGDHEVYSDTNRLKVMNPSLSLDVQGPNDVYVDRDVTHRVTVKNTSDDPAKDTYVDVNVPNGARRVSTSLSKDLDSNGRVNIGTLNAGESRSFDITFQASGPTKLTTSVSAGAYCVESRSSQVRTEVKGIPAIRMEVVDARDPVRVGETTRYLINIKNQGSAPDKEVRLVGKLPDGAEFVRATGETEVSTQGDEVIFEIPSTLQPGKEFDWEVHIRAKEARSAYFTLEMTSSANTRAVTEEESTNFVD